jgi:hypothetical protein
MTTLNQEFQIPIEESLIKPNGFIENDRISMKVITSISAYNSENETSQFDATIISNDFEDNSLPGNNNIKQIFSETHNNDLRNIVEAEKKLREFIEEENLSRMMLERRYPVHFVIVYSIIVILLCISIFIIQICMIATNSKSIYYQIAPGIWVPIFHLTVAILHLVLSKFVFKINFNFYKINYFKLKKENIIFLLLLV